MNNFNDRLDNTYIKDQAFSSPIKEALAQDTPVFVAASEHNFEIVKLLWNLEIDKQVVDTNGCSFAHYACECDALDILKAVWSVKIPDWM